MERLAMSWLLTMERLAMPWLLLQQPHPLNAGCGSAAGGAANSPLRQKLTRKLDSHYCCYQPHASATRVTAEP